MQKNKTEYAKVISVYHAPSRGYWYVLVYPSGERYTYIDKDAAQEQADAWNENNLRIGGVRM